MKKYKAKIASLICSTGLLLAFSCASSHHEIREEEQPWISSTAKSKPEAKKESLEQTSAKITPESKTAQNETKPQGTAKQAESGQTEKPAAAPKQATKPGLGTEPISTPETAKVVEVSTLTLDDIKEKISSFQWQEAVDGLTALAAAKPDDADVQYLLAVVQLRLGNRQKAVEAAVKAANLNPKSLQYGKLAVLLLLKEKRFDEAEELAEKIMKANNDEPTYGILELYVLIGKKQYLRAIELARQLLKKDEVNPEIMKMLALAYYKMGKYKTAKFILKRASEFAKNDWEIALLDAFIVDKTSKDPVKRIAAYAKVLKIKRDIPEVLNNMALIYYQTRNFEKAAQLLEEVIKRAPGFKEAKLNLANAYRAMQDYQKAEQLYKELIKEYPNYADAYFNLGLLYLENEFGGIDREELVQRAVDVLRKYVELPGPTAEEKSEAKKHLADALDLLDSIRKAKEEEARLKAEEEAKWKELSPKGKQKLKELKALRAKLEAAQKAWADAGNKTNANKYQTLLTEFDDLLGPSVQDLETALKEHDVYTLEAVLEDIANFQQEIMPKIDEMFQKIPPPEVKQKSQEAEGGKVEETTQAGSSQPAQPGQPAELQQPVRPAQPAQPEQPVQLGTGQQPQQAEPSAQPAEIQQQSGIQQSSGSQEKKEQKEAEGVVTPPVEPEAPAQEVRPQQEGEQVVTPPVEPEAPVQPDQGGGQ